MNEGNVTKGKEDMTQCYIKTNTKEDNKEG